MPISDYYQSLTRYTKTGTGNGRGGQVLAWASPGTFQGLINQASSQEIEAAARLGIEADYKLFCPVTAPLDHAMRIGDGVRYYRVVSEPKNTVNRGHHYKVLLKSTSLDGD